MKDATATMGAVLPDDVGGRDAVHVAVVAAVAGHDLMPGQAVKLRETALVNDYTAVADMVGIGIVDPYIVGTVNKGQRFWLFLHPRTITSLKHQWTHPAFEETDDAYAAPAKKLASERWLMDYAQKEYMKYDDLLRALTLEDGETYSDPSDPDYFYVRKERDYLHFGGKDAHGDIPEEMWEHAEIVTGKKIKCRPPYFSCSC